MPALFTALGRGEVGAAVISLSDFVLQRRRIPGLVAGPFVGSTSVAAWAVRKADPELRRALDDYITNIRRTPSWSRMAVDYFGPDALTLLGRAKTEKAQ
jgi:ABC-type amino acid transport substrate-binding protein